jgi:phosphoheptose isomerase
MWSHKTKAFKEEQQKALEEKVEEQVQQRLAELSNSEAAEETAEEVAEEVMENAEVEEETVANNNGSSTEDALSLREKFKKAFSKDNVTIQY